jgi:protein-S-isoprenylcysteine O-methyltransferase Ste14
VGGVIHVPPPLVATAAGFVQRLLTRDADPATRPRAVAAGAIALGAAAMAGGASFRFNRSGTTVDPVHPDRASALVTTGPNAISRNPMYVGVTGVLVANAVRRGSVLALLPAAAFVVYVDRLQIVPEEAALREKFGEEYGAYCATVPRWFDQRSWAAVRDRG